MGVPTFRSLRHEQKENWERVVSRGPERKEWSGLRSGELRTDQCTGDTGDLDKVVSVGCWGPQVRVSSRADGRRGVDVPGDHPVSASS